MNLDLDLQSKEWMKDAYCAGYPDPDLWHYETSMSKDEAELNAWRMAEAIRICAICTVRDECLAEGMKDENMLIFNSTDGTIWGGKTLGERADIRDGAVSRKGRKEQAMMRNVRNKIAILNQ